LNYTRIKSLCSIVN